MVQSNVEVYVHVSMQPQVRSLKFSNSASSSWQYIININMKRLVSHILHIETISVSLWWKTAGKRRKEINAITWQAQLQHSWIKDEHRGNQTWTITGPRSQDANNVGVDGAGCVKYSATVYSLSRRSAQHGVAWLSGDWLLRAGERLQQTEAADTVHTRRGKRFCTSPGV